MDDAIGPGREQKRHQRTERGVTGVGRIPDGERTLYQDFKAMLPCYHEAGHAVVAHAAGLNLVWAKAGRSIHRYCHEPVAIPAPHLTRDKRDQAFRIRAVRWMMDVLVAGHLAACIHQEAVEQRKFSCREESRAYSTYWEVPVSLKFESGMQDDPTSDLAIVVRDASNICYAGAAHTVMKPKVTAKDIAKMERGLAKEVLAEIVRSEERAERVLKRHWAAVSDIATSLHRSKAGHLDRRQLLARLERHGVEHGDFFGEAATHPRRRRCSQAD